MAMSDFIIVNNLFEFEGLIKNGINFKGKKIISTNIDLSNKYKKQYDIVNLWKYLDDEIINKSEIITRKISEEFILPSECEIKYKDVNVFDISKIYLRYFYKSIFHTEYALDKLINEFNVDRIEIKLEKSFPLNVTNYDNCSILDGVSEYYFRNKGVKVSNFNFLEEKIYTMPKGFDFEPTEYLFDANELKKNDCKVLFILSENFEWDFDLVKFLQSKHKNIHTVIRSPHRVTKQIQSYNTPVYFSDYDFNTDDLRNEFFAVDTAEKWFFERNFPLTHKYPLIFNNEYLDFQFKDFFGRQKSFLKDLHTFNRINDFVKPEKIYFSNSWDLSVRCMVKSAKDNGVETYATIHGGVVDDAGYLTRKFEVDNYLVWGKDNADGLAKYGQKSGSIKIVGSMQMDFWNKKLNTVNNENTEKSEYDNIYNFNFKRTDKKEKPVITFFTSIGGGFSGHSINEYYQEESLKKIIDLAVNNPGINFKIKPHIIFDYFDFWMEMKANLPANLEVMKETDLMKACFEMDLGVLLNTISNVAYEISLAGKPVVFFKDAVFNCECAESTLERGGILTVKSFEDFEKTITEYFINKNVRRDLEKRRVNFLNHALASQDFSVKERIEKLMMNDNHTKVLKKPELDVYKIINWVQKSIKESKTLNFPELDKKEHLPTGKEMLAWVYNLTDNWCRYYKKNSDLSKHFNKLVLKIPKELGIDSKTKFKNNIYAKSRDLYLKYNLNENEKVRKLVKKFF